MVRNVLVLLVVLGLACGCGRSKTHAVARRSSSATATASAFGPAPAASEAVASAASNGPAALAEPGTIEPLEIGAFLKRVGELGAKGTLVNAFASWCGPCREEVPLLEAMAANLRREGIRLVFVSFDEPDDRAKAEAFLRAHDVRSPAFLALDGLTFRTRLAPRWPGMIPATFLLDHETKLRYFWGGPAYEHEILPIVDGFLAGRAIDGQSSFSLSPGRTE